MSPKVRRYKIGCILKFRIIWTRKRLASLLINSKWSVNRSIPAQAIQTKSLMPCCDAMVTSGMLCFRMHYSPPTCWSLLFSQLYLLVKSDIRIQIVARWHCLVEVTFQRIILLPQNRCWWCLLCKTRVLLEKPWTVPLCSVSNGSLLPRQKLVHITSILLQLAPGQDILKNTISWQLLALVFSADQHQTERRVAAW